MSSLFGTMSVALQSMLAQQGAMGVVANNIANSNTPGYSREVPEFEESPPVLSGNTMIGTGVTLKSVQSVRDNILNLRIDQETSQQSSLGSYVNSMDQVQSLFNETQGTGLQTALSNFFNSFQSLATDPTSSPLRQASLLPVRILPAPSTKPATILRPSSRGWTSRWCRLCSRSISLPDKSPA